MGAGTTKTKVVKLDLKNLDIDIIEEAARIIKRGGVVGFPTDTVYGIGADHSNKEAVNRLYEIKKRPVYKPFTLHISCAEMVEKSGCEITVQAEKLMQRFWPGPLTIILADREGTGTEAFRVPESLAARKFIDSCGVPLSATSANISGKASPKTAEDVLLDLNGKIDLLIDAGPCRMGVDSTVVDARKLPCKIARKGAVSENEIDECVKQG